MSHLSSSSLREGLEETLTLLVLGIEGALYRTLRMYYGYGAGGLIVLVRAILFLTGRL